MERLCSYCMTDCVGMPCGEEVTSCEQYTPDVCCETCKYDELGAFDEPCFSCSNTEDCGAFSLWVDKVAFEKEWKELQDRIGIHLGEEVEADKEMEVDEEMEDDDPVNHPTHYTRGKIEVADFIADQQLNFDLGNAVKYICRAGYKNPDKYVEDLDKAKWYINHEIGMYEERNR